MPIYDRADYNLAACRQRQLLSHQMEEFCHKINGKASVTDIRNKIQEIRQGCEDAITEMDPAYGGWE